MASGKQPVYATRVGAASRPALRDLKACDEWLARAALADPHHACASFVQLLDELEDAPPAAADGLQILERLRTPMLTALQEQQRRFSARALPLSPMEDAAFQQACDLWLSGVRAWCRLLDAVKGASPQLSSARPLIALRGIEFSAGLMAAHFAARREAAEPVWHWVHQSFAAAESHRVNETEVQAGERSTCTAAYSELLLAALAHPYGQSHRELAWTWRWAKRWSPKVKLWRAAEKGGGYAVDLEGCAPPEWRHAGEPLASLRYVECSEVARSIRRRLKKLNEGVEPAALGLGADCPRLSALELLASLLRCWTDAPLVREFPRRPVTARMELVSGFADIHAAVGGRAAESGAKSWEYSRRAADQIHIFQRALDMEARGKAAEPEMWETLDESARGFRIRRTGPGRRIAHRQLVALRPDGMRHALLCEVRWLYESSAHVVNAGVKALPGLAQPCSVRLAGGSTAAIACSPALLLPGADASQDTLVLPSGWYRPYAPVEVQGAEGARQVTLGALVERGYDYDRVGLV